VTASRVSLCATVLNEAESIEPWLESARRQTRLADEIVLCDGGSTDATVERLNAAASRDPRLKVCIAPGSTIGAGRNVAIARAAGPLIAVTDAGTVLDPDWLERLVAPLEADSGVAVSAGFYRPAGRNWFERVLAAVITPRRPDLPADGFPPSSRSVAFRRDWWERVGGYPEWLRTCEDLVFDFELRRRGARFAFADDAIVSWYPRPTLAAFFSQYRAYARGDGHAHLWASRHAARYGAYAFGAALAARARRSPAAAPALALGVALHLAPFARRVRDERPVAGPLEMAAAYALVPAIVVTGDVAKMTGYPQGLWERWRAGEPEGLAASRIASPRHGADATYPISPA
jgi:glycosyltransferase involved in cell wall biosynthesis